jgi:hypothetical protein
MIFIADNVWSLSLTTLDGLLKDVDTLLQDPKARAKMNDSFETLKDIHEALRDEDYVKEEDHILFKDLAIKMEDVFKHPLHAYMIENSVKLIDDKGKTVSLNAASIDLLNFTFAGHISQNRKNRRLHQVYPAVTILVRYLRNCEEHETNKPEDHITGKNSFGNVYTLCSVFIITVYAYKEILQSWSGK